MRICAAQTKPVKGDFEANIKSHLQLVELAGECNADLVVFPELSLLGYEPTLAKELATKSEDKRFDVFQVKSDQHDLVIAVGFPLRSGESIFIAMLVFQPFKDRFTYLKKYLFHTEKAFFQSGESAANLNIKGVNIGLAICYELSVAEHQKVASDKGAEMYVASVVETEDGVNDSLRKMSNTAHTYAMVTSMSNCIGTSGKYECGGRTSIWNEQGVLVGQLSDYEEGVLVYDTESKETLVKIKTG
jgi:predicted amidohydrolase